MLGKLFALTEQGAKDLKKESLPRSLNSLLLSLMMSLWTAFNAGDSAAFQLPLGMETATPSLGAYAECGPKSYWRLFS